MRISLFLLGLVAFVSGCTSSAHSVATSTTTAASSQPLPAHSDDGAEAIATKPANPSDVDGAAPIRLVADESQAAASQSSSPPAIVRRAAKPIVGDGENGVPPVLLSAAHAKLCKVNVGDVIPTIELPQASGAAATLDSLAGARATIVLFWNDHWMSKMALQDLARIAGSDGVSIVGIAVGVPADAAQKRLADAGAKFPQLTDAKGTAFAQVGEAALPRVYVLDAQRRIVWFDIEYSEATYRELQQTLAAVTGGAGR